MVNLNGVLELVKTLENIDALNTAEKMQGMYKLKINSSISLSAIANKKTLEVYQSPLWSIWFAEDDICFVDDVYYNKQAIVEFNNANSFINRLAVVKQELQCRDKTIGDIFKTFINLTGNKINKGRIVIA